MALFYQISTSCVPDDPFFKARFASLLRCFVTLAELIFMRIELTNFVSHRYVYLHFGAPENQNVRLPPVLGYAAKSGQICASLGNLVSWLLLLAGTPRAPAHGADRHNLRNPAGTFQPGYGPSSSCSSHPGVRVLCLCD